MATHRSFIFIGCLILILALLKTTSAVETHTVGDDIKWNIPPGGQIAYRTWANTNTFEIGDTILFTWSGTHDVAEVSQAEYDNCTATNPIGTIQTVSPANFTLTTNATRYFLCTVDGHCGLGQKVAIAIGSYRERNSASSLAVGALSALLSAIVISFLN